MKRGQVTLFIIVGIVMLLILGLAIAAWKYIAYEKPPEEKIVEETNTELSPLKAHIEDCLGSTTEQVLRTIGEQGGYYNTSSYVAYPGRPTSGAAFEPFPGQTLPYWSYVSSPNDCTDCIIDSEQPPLTGSRYPAIQYQAERAVENEITACLGDLQAEFPQYTITIKSTPQVTLGFGEADTTASLDYEMDVQTAAGSVSTLRSFSAPVNIPMKKAYDVASEIRRSSDASHFFEGFTIELIVLESIGDPEPIPPPYGSTTLSYEHRLWTLQQTKKLIAASLERNVQSVQLFGSKGMSYANTGNLTQDNQYANYYFSIGNDTSDVEARFVYLSSWDPYISIHPGGQVIRPTKIPLLLPFITPMQRKDFQYDVSYPVLVQLSMPTNKDDFTFQFPLEVNLRNNDHLTLEGMESSGDELSVCDPAFANGAQATITVHDDSGSPLDDAEVDFVCITESCPIGYSSGGVLTATLPPCVGGFVQVNEPGYAPARSVALDSTAGELSIDLTAHRLTNVVVRPHIQFLQQNLVTVGVPAGAFPSSQAPPATLSGRYVWQLTTTSTPVADPYSLTLVFTPTDDREQAQVISLPEGSSVVPLYPGTYEVTGVLMRRMDEPLVIPADHRCTGGLFTNTCYDIPEVRFGDKPVDENNVTMPGVNATMYVGGIQWDSSTKVVNITADMLARGTIDVPIVAVSLPDFDVVEDLESLDMVGNFSRQLDIR